MTFFKYTVVILDVLSIISFINLIVIQFNIYNYFKKLKHGITQKEYNKLKNMVFGNIVDLFVFVFVLIYNYFFNIFKSNIFNYVFLFILLLYVITFFVNLYFSYTILYDYIYFDNNKKIWKYKENTTINKYIKIFPILIIFLKLFYYILYFFEKYLNYKIKQFTNKKSDIDIDKIYKSDDLIYNFVSYNKLKNKIYKNNTNVNEN
jgi:hypothetical protein